MLSGVGPKSDQYSMFIFTYLKEVESPPAPLSLRIIGVVCEGDLTGLVGVVAMVMVVGRAGLAAAAAAGDNFSSSIIRSRKDFTTEFTGAVLEKNTAFTNNWKQWAILTHTYQSVTTLSTAAI